MTKISFSKFSCFQHYKADIILLIAFLTISSCSENIKKGHVITDRKIVFKPPVRMPIKAPIVTFLVKCPPPRVVVIPTKPGGFSLMKSTSGMKMMQSLPPETKPCDFLSSIKNYNTEQGLSLSSVYCVCQDHNQNLWFGTMGGGLNRYDGKSFTNYTVANGLPSNQITYLTEDRRGNIWISTPGNGISCYDGRSFTNYSTFQGLGDNGVGDGYEDRSGNLWFITGAGISRFDPRKKYFTNYTRADEISNNVVFSVLEDKDGYFWLGGEKGISRFDPDQKSGTRVKPGLVSSVPMGTGGVSCILEDNGGNLWLGTYDGIYRLAYNKKVLFSNKAELTKYTTAEGLVSNNITSLIEDKRGNIWAGTFGGISRLNPNKSLVEGKAEITNYTTAQGLADNRVLSIIEDKNGNIWIGTEGGGISRLSQGGRSLKGYTIKQGIVDNLITSIAEDKKGNLWFATEGGISRLDRQGKSFTNFTSAQGLVDYASFSIIEDKNGNIWFTTQGSGIARIDRDAKIITSYTDAQGLASNYPITISEDKSNNFWFGTAEGGVSRFDGKSFTNYTVSQGLISNIMTCIQQDKKGNMWFGSNEGASCYDGKSFTNYTTDQGLPINYVYCITEDNNGNLWFGTVGGGISRYDGQSFANFAAADGMADNVVTSVVIDKKGIIWIGTNKGLTALKGFTKGIIQKSGGKNEVDLQPSNNLSNDELKQTGCKPVFEIYNENTGYPIKDIYSHMCVSKDNKIWAGTSDKLIQFDYNAIHKNPEPIPLFIQNIKINNENICWYDLEKNVEKVDSNTIAPNISEEATLFSRPLSDEQRDTIRKNFSDIRFDSITRFYPVPVNLVLPYHHNNLTFEFAAIEPSRPKMVNYRYILEGYNSDWSPPGNETSASFGNIYEGNYTFKLKAQSPDGVWSEPIVYRFSVLPPWYRSWWAYTLYLLALITALRALVKWRVSVLKKEKILLEKKVVNRTNELHKEKEKVESTLTELKATQAQLIHLEKTNERLRISRELHDDIGSTLGSISIYSEVAKSRTGKNENPDEALSKIGTSSRELIDKMSDIVWSLNPNNESFEQLQNRMSAFAAMILAPQNIVYEFVNDEKTKEIQLAPEQRKNIFLIYKEAIYNIVKYADCKKVIITFSLNQNTLMMTIKDDGKGFDFAAQNAGNNKETLGGNGIKNMQVRAGDIYATLDIYSVINQGTRIELNLTL